MSNRVRVTPHAVTLGSWTIHANLHTGSVGAFIELLTASREVEGKPQEVGLSDIGKIRLDASSCSEASLNTTLAGLNFGSRKELKKPITAWLVQLGQRFGQPVITHP